MNGVFITGTDTDAGKTFVSAIIIKSLVAAGFKVAGLKPIASGFSQVDGEWVNDDVQALTQASNVNLPSKRVNRYAFTPAIAPHIAAKQAGEVLDFDDIAEDVQFASKSADIVLVEGVGGWHVPLLMPDEEQIGGVKDIESLAVSLNLPVILVVGLRLGCLNHAILTAQAIKQSGVPLLGWIANHIDSDFAFVEDNLQTLEALLPVPKLFEVKRMQTGESFDLPGEVSARLASQLMSV